MDPFGGDEMRWLLNIPEPRLREELLAARVRFGRDAEGWKAWAKRLLEDAECSRQEAIESVKAELRTALEANRCVT